MPHHRLVEAARRHGHCLTAFRLSLAAYRLRRAIGVGRVYSRVVVAVLGITAGSGFATTEMRMLLLGVVDEAYTFWPTITLALYVDGFTIEVHGADE